MAVTIQRPTGTTVPRKLELVNVSCVETLPSHCERPMIVNEMRAAIDTELLPFSGSADMLPPFWELEELIGQGFDPERALAVIAAKRSGQGPAVSSSDRVHALTRHQQPARNEPLRVVLCGC